MPRYYFNVTGDGFEAIDAVGLCCADDVAALHGALRTASAVLHKRLRSDDLSQSGWIEVEDERHRPVLKLPLRAASY